MTKSFSGSFEVLEQSECWHLLRTQNVGRVAWKAGGDIQVLPVNYQMADECTVVFCTDTNGLLATLVERTEVAFQLDDIDTETQTGWSVLARATSKQLHPDPSQPLPDPDPWAPGQRSILIGLTPTELSGRIVVKDS